MKHHKPLIKIILAGVLMLFVSCTKEEAIPREKAQGKTSLFEQVNEPEPSASNSGSEEGVHMTLAEDSRASSGSTSTGSGASGHGDSKGQFEPGILTAGEWNDLEHWDFWNDLLKNQEYFEDVNKWNLKEIKRYSFIVKDPKELPVPNAEIILLSGEEEVWKVRTDNKGKATLWSDLGLNNLTAIVKYKDTEKVVEALAYDSSINSVVLDQTTDNKKIIDLYFAVDATGSMSDEIDYLKAELNNVIEQIKENNPSLEMRFGSVFYRDEGDEYVTRSFDFTDDETRLISFISEQSAQGGGDFPEAVHTALDVAITQNSWNNNASARILFLLLDAPPHYTQEAVSSMELNLIKAAEKGIKIIPITASGVDKSTEYLMRSFAILTNGTYVFITDDSGVGNDHLEPTIGEFSVEKLNELLVRLIGEYVL
ncbi:VWA domain-containing protein [Wenyingzhuangia sp.]|uniref:vWA domain-containing protein n=1 Tax=Wenyingzhuangia sp. TaxID=1964193 RepID=UPI00321A33E3